MGDKNAKLEKRLTTLENNQGYIRNDFERVENGICKQINGIGGRIDELKVILRDIDSRLKNIDVILDQYDIRFQTVEKDIKKLKEKPWLILKRITIVTTVLSGVLGLIWLAMLIHSKM